MTRRYDRLWPHGDIAELLRPTAAFAFTESGFHSSEESNTCDAGARPCICAQDQRRSKSPAASGVKPIFTMQGLVMRAMVIPRFGGPHVFEERDIDRPQPGPGEVLVRVVCSGTNPVDAKLRANGTWLTSRRLSCWGTTCRAGDRATVFACGGSPDTAN